MEPEVERTLPGSGQESPDSIAESIRAMMKPPALIHSPVIRAVLIRSEARDDDWHCSAQVVQFAHAADSLQPTKEEITIDRVRLLSIPLETSAFDAGHSLVDRLARLLRQPSLPGVASPQGCSVQKYHGRTKWGPTPAWIVHINVHDSATGISRPEGPFLIQRDLEFQETFVDLVRWWTGDFSYSQASDNRAMMIVPDARGYITDIHSTAVGLDLHVAGSESGVLRVAFIADDIHGGECKSIVRVQEGIARITFERSIRSFRVFLIAPDSTCIDSHYENHHSSEVGESLFSPERARRAPRMLALKEALRTGEDVRTEYKAWLPTSRDNERSRELLETTVAFANAEGGSIYIGVDNHGDIVGIERALREVYRQMKERPVGVIKEQYVEDLRKRITAEIRPRMVPAFTWIENSGMLVLQVGISEGVTEPYYIEATGECFVRRGSTNKRASPPEVKRIEAGRAPHPIRKRGL